MDNENILDLILSKKDFLPKKQRQLCEFIVKNFSSMGIMTISDLAQKAGVGTTTVMRVMAALGYQSFNDFKKEFHSYSVVAGMSTWWHLQKSFSADDIVENNSIDRSWKEVTQVLTTTLNKNFTDNVYKTVDLILSKQSVNILGLRTSKVMAIYLENLLSEFYHKTNQLSYDSEFVFDKVSLLGKEDVVVIFAMSPFTKISLDVAEYCYANDIPIVLITDNYSCPIASFAEVVLHTQASANQYSIVPAIALIESLVIEIGKRTSDYSIDRLEKLGGILKEKNITI